MTTDYGICTTRRSPDYMQDPDEILDYEFNFSAELGTDTIDTATLVFPDGLAEDSSSNTDTTVTVFVDSSGGSQGSLYRITARITTLGGRTHDKTITLLIDDR